MNKQHTTITLLILAVLINVALCDTFQFAHIDERRGVRSERRLQLTRLQGFSSDTFDLTVNIHCSEEVYLVNNLQDTLLCFKGGEAHLISQTSHQKHRGKILSAFARVLVEKPNSTAQEKLAEIIWTEKEPWFHQNRTCMTARRDPKQCVDKYGNHIVDATIQQKPCFFVHGVGERGNNTITNSFVEYWGYVKDYMPQCNSYNFLRMDTKNNSWTSEFLVKKVCSLISGGSMKITNSYVFTHSMGGLIMTNGLMKGWCSIDKSSARLFMSQPPLKGSITARFVNDICKGDYGGSLQVVAVNMDYCLPNNAGAYPAYFPMDPDNPQLKSLQYAAGVFNDGMMCGNCDNAVALCGFGSPQEAAGLKAIAVVSGLQFPNDGMVSLDSCKVPNPKWPFTTDYTQPYYLGAINHADGTCRNGDSTIQGLYPCKWFGARYIS